VTNKSLIGSSNNLLGMRSKLTFAQKVGSPSVLDRRLHKDAREYGLDAFTFEVLETLDVSAHPTPAAVREELTTLEALWRANFAPTELY
jgi:hypothetical protein